MMSKNKLAVYGGIVNLVVFSGLNIAFGADLFTRVVSVFCLLLFCFMLSRDLQNFDK